MMNEVQVFTTDRGFFGNVGPVQASSRRRHPDMRLRKALLCLLASTVQSFVPSSSPIYPGRLGTPKAQAFAAPVAPVDIVPDIKRQLREARLATRTIATTCRHALISAVTPPIVKTTKVPVAAKQVPKVFSARLQVANSITQLPSNAIKKVDAAKPKTPEAETRETRETQEKHSIRTGTTRANNHYSAQQEANLGIWLQQYQRTRELALRGPAIPVAAAPAPTASTNPALTTLQQGAASRVHPKQSTRTAPTTEPCSYYQPFAAPPEPPKPKTAAEVARERTAGWEAQWEHEKKAREWMEKSRWYDPFGNKEERMPAYVKSCRER